MGCEVFVAATAPRALAATPLSCLISLAISLTSKRFLEMTLTVQLSVVFETLEKSVPSSSALGSLEVVELPALPAAFSMAEILLSSVAIFNLARANSRRSASRSSSTALS